MTSGTDNFILSDPLRRRLRRLSRAERTEEAEDFLRTFASETGLSGEWRRARIKEVRAQIRRNGQYEHSGEELEFGARLAWRNHARCVGRLTWKSLQVHDRRHLREANDILSATLATLEQASSSGRIRSSITIFAPATETSLPATFESPQIFQYAGYAEPGIGVIGDRANIELTNIARQLGWSPEGKRGQFDLLPVILRDGSGARQAFSLPRPLAREVLIRHPTNPGLAMLDLRWYAVPVVTNMVLAIGGIDYPCAPFNGYYVATEIASRNFVDVKRFDLLEPIARGLGLKPGSNGAPLWKDVALTELNRAVLYSFDRAGITIADHHRASSDYMTFVQLEQRAGRIPSGEWSWIVPPQASAACATYHLPMTNQNAVPNFYHARHLDGAALHVDRSYRRDGVWRARYERLKRRWRNWRRQRDRIWQRL